MPVPKTVLHTIRRVLEDLERDLYRLKNELESLRSKQTQCTKSIAQYEEGVVEIKKFLDEQGEAYEENKAATKT